MNEKEFDAVPLDQKDILRKVIADATGQDVTKIGDGHILALLQKLLPLLIQVAPWILPLFGVAMDATKERKIGDGTILAALLAALQNPQFVQTLAAIIALFKKPAPAA